MLENENGRKKTTVEDLLRVKRSEVPSEEFWKGFDRQLEKRIVQSVVRRRSFAQFTGEWFLAHGKGVAATALVVLGAALYFPGTGSVDTAGESGTPPQDQARIESSAAAPATSSSPVEGTVPAAPSLAVADHDFVIEVLSSKGSAGGGSDLVFAGGSERSGQGAYYVADQLSSKDHGWSGERLPF